MAAVAREDSSTETLEISRDVRMVQTVNSHAVGVQTEDNEAIISQTEYDEEKLAKFLRRVCPAVVTELDRVSRNSAFASYSLVGEGDEEVFELLNIPSSSEGVKVVDISWSCTGSVLAVARSHVLHSGWCDHQGCITLYNIDREGRSLSCTINTTSCVRSVCMHPYIASIVAAGTFSGEVVVWDTVRETALASVTAGGHGDTVTQVRWTLGTGASVTLASAALDGLLLLWTVSPHMSVYQVMERYTFQVSNTQAGVTAFAFPHHKQDIFVVCLEGGAILHCSTTGAKPVASGLESLMDPVICAFEQQPATVTCVEFSPHHEDVFATVATDQAIRIFSLSQRCSQRVIWAGAMVGVGWSPVQAHVIAAWGHSNKVELYNSNTCETLNPLCPDSYKDKNQISCVRFNHKSNRLLALGDLAGNVSVWEIPSHKSAKTSTGIIN